MKRALVLVVVCLLCLSARAQLIYGTLTITNSPTNGYSATLAGISFYWTNAATGNGFIQASNTFGWDATNVFNYLNSNSVSVAMQSSNVVVFNGTNITGTISTNWATLSFASSTLNYPTNVTPPAQDSGPIINTGKTNVTALGSYVAVFATPFPDANYSASQMGLGFNLTNSTVTIKTTTNCTFTNNVTTGLIYWVAVHQ